jgi:uncharacterized membrane protein
MAKKKFDTNPLDPEYPQKVAAEAAMAAGAAPAQQAAGSTTDLSAQTRSFGDEPADATRRYGNINYVPDYQSPDQAYGLTPPATTRLDQSDFGISSNRKVDKIGLPENILVALPYLPWGIGLVAGLVELFLVQKSEPKVRFHAAQGLAIQIGILLISTMLGFVGNFSDWADDGKGIFQLVATIMSFVFAYKAYKGKPLHIEAVEDLANWLDEKIAPRS